MTNSSFSESFLFGPAFRACKILENTKYNSNFKLFNSNHNYTYISIYTDKVVIQFFFLPNPLKKQHEDGQNSA